MMMNEYNREQNPSCCYFHPREKIVGICALCLKERLIILASKQGHQHSLPKDVTRTHNGHTRKSTLTIPKIFDLGSFLHRRTKSIDIEIDDDDDASTSQEDSFISMKFEDNGIASWDKGTNSKVALKPLNKSTNNKLENQGKGTKSMIEHVKPHAVLRWRKRIGQIFQIIRRKKSNGANVCHVGSKVGGVKVRKGWIRSLTKRRTKE